MLHYKTADELLLEQIVQYLIRNPMGKFCVSNVFLFIYLFIRIYCLTE